MINDLLTEGEENYKDLRNNYLDTITYSNMSIQMFSLYFLTKRRDFDRKSNFHIILKTYNNKKMGTTLEKNPYNYEKIRDQTCVNK